MIATKTELSPAEARRLVRTWRNDWNVFARDMLAVKLDKEQQECLHGIQNSHRISIRSGNARGKDFVAAVASVCFLELNVPSKVIETAPTGRQAISIMMSEIKKLYMNAEGILPLGGFPMTDKIVFPANPDRYLMAFKAGEKQAEPWSGFHSPHLMVVVTEATGLADEVFDAVESILTGDSKLLICFNPYTLSGEAYRSITSPAYKKYRLNCLDAPNVVAKKILIPGQVDYAWVNNLIVEKKWAKIINEEDFKDEENDFEFQGKLYRPNDLFRIKVLGEPPKESDDLLIPLAWIDSAFKRFEDIEDLEEIKKARCSIGADIAGEGRDFTVFFHRFEDVATHFQEFGRQDHMVTVGRLGEALGENARAFIDTIGEGAGVYSRARELKLNVVSAKFSESAKGLRDYSRQRSFVNIRAYCYWAIRDALNPEYDVNLAICPDEELREELHEIHWSMRSNGDIILEPKENIKSRIGRSPDKADALALSYYPKRHHGIHV